MNVKKNNPLAEYLKLVRLPKAVFARDVGISPQRLQIYLREGAVPPLELAYKIQEATKDKVKMSDWVK